MTKDDVSSNSVTTVSGTTPVDPGVTVTYTTEPPQPAGTTLTQDEVNKLVGGARVEARTAFLKKHGFKSEEDLESALTKAKELEEAQLTELEKANMRIEELAAQAEAAKADAEKMRLAVLRSRIGREKGLPDPLIDKLVGIDEEEITAEVEALLPFVKGSEEPPSVGGGTNPASAGSMGGSPDEKMAAALVRAVRGG